MTYTSNTTSHNHVYIPHTSGSHTHSISTNAYPGFGSAGYTFNGYPVWKDERGRMTYADQVGRTYEIDPVTQTTREISRPSWDTSIKEKEVSTLDKIRQQRQEERERGRIERMYAEYDASVLGDATEGSVITFTWRNREARKRYRYLGLYTNDAWYLTGGSGPQQSSYEDLVAWLIARNVELSNLRFGTVEWADPIAVEPPPVDEEPPVEEEPPVDGVPV